MLDIILSSILAVLTFGMAYLGIHVTLHPPNESRQMQHLYKAGFLACGFLALCIVVWQGSRNLKAQRAFNERVSGLQDELHETSKELTDTKQQVTETRQQIADARIDEKAESARRQQAEKDFKDYILGVGNSTRTGVAEDIKKSPISVNVAGQSAADIAKAQAIRDKLGELLEHNQRIKMSCFTVPPPTGFSCILAANAWYGDTYQYIARNMEPSYKARFVSASGLSLQYNAAAGDANKNSAINELTFKAAALADFIKEQH